MSMRFQSRLSTLDPLPNAKPRVREEPSSVVASVSGTELRGLSRVQARVGSAGSAALPGGLSLRGLADRKVLILEILDLGSIWDKISEPGSTMRLRCSHKLAGFPFPKDDGP